jgi:hypothetical protein
VTESAPLKRIVVIRRAGIDLEALRRNSPAFGPGLKTAGVQLCAQWLKGLPHA